MASESDSAHEPSLNRRPQQLGWIVAIVAIGWFVHEAVRFDTPIDRALPVVAVLLTVVAWVSRSWLTAAIPLLVVVELFVPDERLRLIAFGAVAAVTIAVALVVTDRPRREGATLLVVAIAIVLLRWIPVGHVALWRESVLLVTGTAIAAALGSTPFAAAVAIIAALLPPLVPLRTLAFPLAVLVSAGVLRMFGLPRIHLRIAGAAVVAGSMLFFPWSGLLVRAPRLLLVPWTPAVHRAYVGAALHPGNSMSLDVPTNATALIASGANVSRLRGGTVIGRIDGAPITIGQIADWGFLRREHRRNARNPLPRDPAGILRGYGYDAWVDGAGRIPLPPGARTIVVTVERNLPPDAALQVEGFEVKP